MAKPIQYYVLARGGLYARRGFRVIGVTSEKGRQVYGRDEHDAATHVSASDVIHRFPEGTSLDFAKAATERADAEYKRHEVAVRMAREELSRVEDLRQQRTLEAAKGILATHPAPTQHTMDGGGLCVEGDRCRCADDAKPGCDSWRNQDHTARFKL